MSLTCHEEIGRVGRVGRGCYEDVGRVDEDVSLRGCYEETAPVEFRLNGLPSAGRVKRCNM